MKTCTKCKLQKSLDSFWKDNRRGGYLPHCKSCKAEAAKKWRSNNPEKSHTRYWNNPAVERERHLIRKYGVNLAKYDAMLASQNGKCAICGSLESEQFKGVFHIDHCHTTGNVRGLLCRGCNHMLGVVKDDPEILSKAIEYLSVPQVAAEVIKAYMECRPC